MTVNGPHKFSYIHHLQQVEADREDDNNEDRKRRRVNYLGRSWAESEEDLKLQSSLPDTNVKQKPQRSSVINDKVLNEKVQEYFEKLTILEDKVAQLCIYQAAAWYEHQELMENIIQQWQIGGLLFIEGSDIRQSFLIERFQKIAKVPLLFGSDLPHALSLYYRTYRMDSYETSPLQKEEELITLGRNVMHYHKRLGMHFLYMNDSSEEKYRDEELHSLLSKEQYPYFSKGIRQAQGLIGKERSSMIKSCYAFSTKASDSSNKKFLSPMIEVEYAKEVIGMKTLHFHSVEASMITKPFLENFFKSSDDLLLLGVDAPYVIERIVRALREGIIKEYDLDRKVIRLLASKIACINSKVDLGL